MMAATKPLRTPAWQSVLREQVSTALLVLRPFFFAVIAVLFLGDALILSNEILAARIPHPVPVRGMNVSFGPEESIIAVCFAIILALLLWIDDDRAKRAYHWSMPVPRHQHAFLKVTAGWIAAMALTAAFIANVLLLSASVTHIQHRPLLLLGGLPWWTLLVPLTSVTVAYTFASAACVGAQRPIVWVGGLPVLFAGLVMLCSGVTVLRRFYAPLLTVWSGTYGISTILGDILHDAGDAGLLEHANVWRWMASIALWGACALTLLLLTANRPPERA